eukprot:scaffold147_cov164-Ochromonas_danica.AAC.14
MLQEDDDDDVKQREREKLGGGSGGLRHNSGTGHHTAKEKCVFAPTCQQQTAVLCAKTVPAALESKDYDKVD